MPRVAQAKDACITRYDNVCVSQIRPGKQRLHFSADRSACDGEACSEHCALNHTPWARRCSNPRFPIHEHVLQQSASVWYEPAVALLPSLPTGLLRENMAHFFYDTLLLEAEIWLRTSGRVSIVLGHSMHSERPHDLAQELRRRLFAGSRFETPEGGQRCFKELWSYGSACDRSSRTYGQKSLVARVQLLRSLANYTETPTSNVVFYARSDTQRRRLLNARGHFAAVHAMYRNDFRPVFWDDIWSNGQPSVDEQIHLVRNSARMISPHGTFTSVWSLFLRPGALVYELTASCYLYTWLPVPYLKQPPLSLRHVYLSWRLSDEAKARGWAGPLLELVHPKTGKAQPWTSPWCCCHGQPRDGDFDLQLPPDELTRGLGIFDPKHSRRVFKGSEF